MTAMELVLVDEQVLSSLLAGLFYLPLEHGCLI